MDGGVGMAAPEIVKVESEGIARSARTLALAMQDDPAMGWAARNAERRRRLGPRYFEAQLRHVYVPKGEVYATRDGEAVAMWAPPDSWYVSTREALPLLPVMVRVCRTQLHVGFKMLSLLDKKHKEHSDPHYYLAFAGTVPHAQGHGFGSALLAYMTQRCDAEGAGGYLEATTVRNQSLYFRHGFEVVEECNWPGGGPPFWRMWRHPR